MPTTQLDRSWPCAFLRTLGVLLLLTGPQSMSAGFRVDAQETPDPDEGTRLFGPGRMSAGFRLDAQKTRNPDEGTRLIEPRLMSSSFQLDARETRDPDEEMRLSGPRRMSAGYRLDAHETGDLDEGTRLTEPRRMSSGFRLDAQETGDPDEGTRLTEPRRMSSGFRLDAHETQNPDEGMRLSRPGPMSAGFRLDARETRNPDEGTREGRPWLEKALRALDAATRFFEKNYERIILDGIFGLRVAEGQLVSALQSLAARDPSPAVRRLTSRVAHLQARMHSAARAAIPFLLADNQKYFQVFSDMVYRPYLVTYHPREVATPPHKKAMAPLPPPYYLEKKGDSCFAGLMGQSLSDDEPAPPRCTISRVCYHMMTDPGKTDYTLTHQVLFFIQAQHAGCGDKIKRLFGTRRNLEEFEKKKCNKIYSEATELSKEGYVEPHLQDLFLEQGVVCGMIGFESFLRPDWLNMITGWQSDKGCFTDDDDAYKPKRFRKRRLLYEEEIQGNTFTGRKSTLLGLTKKPTSLGPSHHSL